MKLLTFTLISLWAVALCAQPQPRMQRVSIGQSGCAVSFPGAPPQFTFKYSDDRSEIWQGQSVWEDFIFGIICVHLSLPAEGSLSENEVLLKGYLDYLQLQLDIIEGSGYTYRCELPGRITATGITTRWTDADEAKWVIGAWIDRHFLAVLYITGTDWCNEALAAQYFRSFRMP